MYNEDFAVLHNANNYVAQAGAHWVESFFNLQYLTQFNCL